MPPTGAGGREGIWHLALQPGTETTEVKYLVLCKPATSLGAKPKLYLLQAPGQQKAVLFGKDENAEEIEGSRERGRPKT